MKHVVEKPARWIGTLLALIALVLTTLAAVGFRHTGDIASEEAEERHRIQAKESTHLSGERVQRDVDTMVALSKTLADAFAMMPPDAMRASLRDLSGMPRVVTGMFDMNPFVTGIVVSFTDPAASTYTYFRSSPISTSGRFYDEIDEVPFFKLRSELHGGVLPVETGVRPVIFIGAPIHSGDEVTGQVVVFADVGPAIRHLPCWAEGEGEAGLYAADGRTLVHCDEERVLSDPHREQRELDEERVRKLLGLSRSRMVVSDPDLSTHIDIPLFPRRMYLMPVDLPGQTGALAVADYFYEPYLDISQPRGVIEISRYYGLVACFVALLAGLVALWTIIRPAVRLDKV